ncbi:MAG: class I SAM-dependent methyltransferase [Candidatus Omnitrophota bacterium]
MEKKGFAYEGIQLGGPRHVYRQELILRFLKEVHMSGRVLDAGCGDGCISLQLAKSGWEVYALDYSLDFLNILKERLAAENLTKYVQICHKDLESLDFPGSFFDAIVCGEVLEHIKDDTMIMSLFNRILKPNGVCVVTVPVVSKSWDKSDDFFGHQRLYSLDSLKNKIENNGFRLEKYLFWGFPLMKIYYRFIYLPWFKRADNYREKQKSITTKIGKSKFISSIGAKIFRFDEIFGHCQRGVGLAARLRKIS